MRRLYVLTLLIAFSIFLPAYTFADTTYTVKKGDSLYKISKKIGVPIKDIKTKNNITSNRIKPGIKLQIPEQDKKQDVSSDTPHLQPMGVKPKLIIPETKDENSVNTAEDITQSYKVKKGDTLLKIAKNNSVSVKDIKELNELKTARIKPGQILFLRRGESEEQAKKHEIISAAHTEKEKAKGKTEYYTVKRGDTLSSISKKYSISIEEIKENNNLRSIKLKPGQQLLVKRVGPKTYVVKKGDTLYLIAKKFKNIPYRFGANNLFGIDCSGFVQKVYGMIGINLPRSARQQFQEGDPIDRAELSIGDLVFFRTYAPFPSHVGIYLGDNLFIHASSVKKKVSIDNLTTPYYFKRFIGAKRFIEEGEEEVINGG